MTIQHNTGFLNSIPPATKNIIIINLLIWIASLVLPRIGIDLIQLLGLHLPWARDFNAFQFISYMFLHDTHSFSHVFFNMFAVYMFGRVLENVWGSKRFLIYYFVTGIGAGLIQEVAWYFELRDLLQSSHEMVNMGGAILSKGEYLNYFVTIGASGAVFGILLAFGMLFPNTPLFIMFIPIPVKAKYFVIFYGLAELFLGVASFNGDSVAHFAHLGGMLFGYFMIRYWKKKDTDNGRYFY
ncbi:MAG: rhomboid family intramembrane serine protease [Massilibacteroides sp.]|nr:rhomboid family intramembrane serine protease [Massilibacteroides sp.]MDD3062248.1 rhomboid family intramembrane serine protease [Massilibacteroides sp.]MDD4114013.1 rhomboid family intramembrane serine protease [Massilibacteroides sp.]MDD4660021.1 rhomboid family intramembrane serine protease [Massilibacteroides sp.]